MKKSQKGFTLIELLVVIAIIGILASVILASLNSARSKASVAKIKSELNSARTQAELYHGANANSYASVCLTGAVGGIDRINKFVLDAAEEMDGTSAAVFTGTSVQSATSATYRTICRSTATAWVASVPTNKGTATGFWCVDSMGASKAQTTPIAASTYVCP